MRNNQSEETSMADEKEKDLFWVYIGGLIATVIVNAGEKMDRYGGGKVSHLRQTKGA